jgi:hypothetical protein
MPLESRYTLDVVNTGSACVDLAVPALEYPPMRTGVAQVAGPLDECIVRLDHLEGVSAGVGDGHDAKIVG